MQGAGRELAARLQRYRDIERVCLTRRLVGELLDELARACGIASEIDRRIAACAALALAALSADRFPLPPLPLLGGVS